MLWPKLFRTIDLTGWELSDTAGTRQTLSGELPAGATVRVALTAAVQLGNGGDTIRLADDLGTVVDRAAYQATEVRAGRTIALGR